MSIARNAAVLTLLLATHPELTELPLTWPLDGEDSIWVQSPHRGPRTEEIAATLALALGAKHHRSENRTGPDPFIAHDVYGEFAGVGINFQGFANLRDDTGEPAPLVVARPTIDQVEAGEES